LDKKHQEEVLAAVSDMIEIEKKLDHEEEQQLIAQAQ